MNYKPPKAIAKAGIETGATKAKLSSDKALVAGFLAGAYIAFAGLLAFTVTAGMPERIWGTAAELLRRRRLRARADPRRQVRRRHGRAAAGTARGHSAQEGGRGDGAADLPARRRLQLAGLPRGLDGTGRRGRRRQGAGDLLPAAYCFLYAQPEEEPEEPGDTPSGAPERTAERVTA
jgi:hypothetical protein